MGSSSSTTTLWGFGLMVYLQGQGDLVRGLIMGIIRLIIWGIGAF